MVYDTRCYVLGAISSASIVPTAVITPQRVNAPMGPQVLAILLLRNKTVEREEYFQLITTLQIYFIY